MQILIALDQLLNTLLGGWADETLSARAYRQQDKRRWYILMTLINMVFFLQPNHCQNSYVSELNRKHISREYRD